MIISKMIQPSQPFLLLFGKRWRRRLSERLITKPTHFSHFICQRFCHFTLHEQSFGRTALGLVYTFTNRSTSISS
jgi:hypothetical protein